MLLQPPALLADTPPLEPDEPTGREWVLEELSKAEYARARPNPIDEFFAGLWEWVRSLLETDPNAPFTVNPLIVIIGLVVVGAIVALIVFGRPRRIAARSHEPGSVFLDDDERTVAELRAAAERAAAQGDWALATTERFRAIARALGDRTLIAAQPGTTAQGVARSAERVFPSEREPLHLAANAFDGVRYLDDRGSRERYAMVAELDARLEQARPARLPAVVGA